MQRSRNGWRYLVDRHGCDSEIAFIIELHFWPPPPPPPRKTGGRGRRDREDGGGGEGGAARSMTTKREKRKIDPAIVGRVLRGAVEPPPPRAAAAAVASCDGTSTAHPSATPSSGPVRAAPVAALRSPPHESYEFVD